MEKKKNKKSIDILGKLSVKDKMIMKIFETIFKMKGLNPLYPIPEKNLPLTEKVFKMQSCKIQEGDEIIYRRVECKDGLAPLYGNFKSYYDVFEESVILYPNLDYLGTRKLISEEKTVGPDGKPLIRYKLGDYEWLSYKVVDDRTTNISIHFHSLGFNKDTRMGIFADTSAEWIQTFLSLMKISSPAVTVYSTLGDEAIIYSLNLTEASGVFVDFKSKDRILKFIEKIPSIKILICHSNCKIVKETKELENGRKIELIGIDTLFSSSITIPEDLPRPKKPTLDDLILIMFTSGSTGTPKGVMISHRNILSVIAGAGFLHKPFKNKTYIGYLPLAHIMEFTAELVVTTCGGRVGFGMPLTLLDTGTMLKESKGDLSVLRPDYFTTVPVICEKIRNGVIDKIKKGPRVKQIVFQLAYNVKSHYLKTGRLTPFLDNLVFKKIKAAFGGNLKGIIIGGAKLSAETDEFMNVCFGNAKQGYGLTETSIGVSISDFEYLHGDNVGAPIMCNDVKLVKCEEGGYDPLDRDRPSGEVCVSGDNVAVGYYKNELATNDAFKIDPLTGRRWFHTGDIAEITKDLCIKIIDRKKDITKLKHGEYVPLSKIENFIQQSRFVDNNCVAPNSDMEHLVALVVPNRVVLLESASEIEELKGLTDVSVLLKNPTLQKLILDSIESCLQSGKLEKYEKPKIIHLIPDEWLPESNMVTPTLKIRRMAITQRYANLLE